MQANQASPSVTSAPLRPCSDAAYHFGNARTVVPVLDARGIALALCILLLRDGLKLATRAACSAITRALSSSVVPAGSPRISTFGLDQIGRRGHPPQLAL